MAKPLLVVGLACAMLMGCQKAPPVWATALGGKTYRYDALSTEPMPHGDPDEVHVSFEIGPPTGQKVEDKAGRDWEQWAKFDLTIDVEEWRGIHRGLDVKSVSPDGVERDCVLEGGQELPQSGSKAKRTLLVPAVSEMKTLRFENTYFKAVLENDGAAWTVADDRSRRALAEAEAKKNASEERSKAWKAKGQKLVACCAAIEAAVNAAGIKYDPPKLKEITLLGCKENALAASAAVKSPDVAKSNIADAARILKVALPTECNID